MSANLEMDWGELTPADTPAAEALVAASKRKLAEKQAAYSGLVGQAKKQGYGVEMDWSQLTPEGQPTAAHEAVMRDTGVNQATADKFLKSPSAKRVSHLPPQVPTAAAPIDQIAANYEALKANGDLSRLSPADYATFTAPLKAAGWEVGADYIKPPSAQPGRYPLWEKALAGPEVPPADIRAPITRTLASLGGAFANVIGGMAGSAGKVAGAVITGKAQEAVKGASEMTIQPQIDQFAQAHVLYEKNGGKVDPEIAAHALAGVIPFLGPIAASFGEKVGKGTGKITVGDTSGWEDLISAVPDAAMLIAPYLPKAFEAIRGGKAPSEAMASVADQIKPLLEKRLKETIAPEGGPLGTGAKPKVVAERGRPQEVTNARQGTQIQPEAGSAGEAYSGVGRETGNVAEAGPVGGVRNRQQAEVQPPQGEIANEPQSQPFIAYHGTRKPVERLEVQPGENRMVEGIYLSKDRAEAEKYTKEAGKKRPENVQAYYVDLKNPYIRTEANARDLYSIGGKLTEVNGRQRTAALKALGYDGLIDETMNEVVAFDANQLKPLPKGEIANEPQPVSGLPGAEPVAGPAQAEAQAAPRPVAEAGAPGETQPASAEAKVATKIPGERSLPKTLAAANLEPGTDLTYDVIPNEATVAAANERVAIKGIDQAIGFVESAKQPTAEHTATGFAVIRALQDQGDFAKAAEVASDLSAKLTTAGQSVQAVKTIAQFAPERAVTTAQKILGEKKLSPIQAERITKAAKGIEEATAGVVKADAKLDVIADKLPATSPANWRAKLTAAEEGARARLADRAARMKEGSLKEFGSGGLSTEEIMDYATIGAAKLARKGIDSATWLKEMADEFGDTIKPHLARIYRQSFEMYSAAKRDAYDAMKERAVTKGMPPMTAEEIRTAIQQRDLAIKSRTAATRGLAREYEALQPGARIKRELVSAANAPRALRASLDLSAPLRQGAIFVTEPKLAAQAFGEQIRALTERGHERAYLDIKRNPAFIDAQTSGLEFTGSPLRTGDQLSLREEAFMSKWAERVPGVAASERAYTTYLDSLRMNVFEKYAKEIKQAVSDPKQQAAEMKSIAGWINKATGRGDLGRLNSMAPILNSAFFAPRYAISRFQILNPVMYAKMSPVARQIALRKMFQFTGVVGTTLALAKAGGLQVGTDPRLADFLKIKSGDTRFDILAGMQQDMRLAARVARGFYLIGSNEKIKESETPDAIVRHYLRGKLAPIPAGIANVATGKTYEGEPIIPQPAKGQPPLTFREKVKEAAGREAVDLFVPMFLEDAYKAWKSQDSTATKTAATGAGLLGVGVQTYKSKLLAPETFKRLSLEDAANVYRGASPTERQDLYRELSDKYRNTVRRAKTPADRQRIQQTYNDAIAAP